VAGVLLWEVVTRREQRREQGREQPPGTAARRSWWVDAGLAAGFTALTVALAQGVFLALDLDVDHWCRAHRPTALYWLARAGNYLGQGTWLAVISLGIAVVLGWRRRSVRLVLPVLAAELISGLAVFVFKETLHRAPPNNQNHVPHPERLFSDPASQSYPSGHLVVAIVWYGVLAMLLTGVLPATWRRALRVVPPVVLFVTTVYLSFHWLTDSIAGLLLGLLLYRLLFRVPWETMPLGRRGWTGPGLPETPPR
jgi:membrane-associated phospholipid phosphatase